MKKRIALLAAATLVMSSLSGCASKQYSAGDNGNSNDSGRKGNNSF